MGEFSDEILGFVPEILANHQEEGVRQTAEELARASAEEERRRIEQAADETYKRLGKEAVRLLQKHRVPTLMIYARPSNNGPVTHMGHGWFALESTYYDGGDLPPTTSRFALRDTGVILPFSRTLYTGNGRYGDPKNKKFSGIVFPDEPLSGQKGLAKMESEGFKRGIASLIATGEPYRGK